MLSRIFLGMALVGAEWVLYFLIALSIISVALIIERLRFYGATSRGLAVFRQKIRTATASNKWEEAITDTRSRLREQEKHGPDLETGMTMALLEHRNSTDCSRAPEILTEIAHDSVIRARLEWEKQLAILATIGSNAPFIGLFGTVLGIIKAFHDLSQQAGAGAQTVTAGISEALVATAVGILVAVPAVVAYNIFQRRVKTAVTEAEALKSFLIGLIGKTAGK